MLAIEYNGREHLTPERADEDLVREQLIVAAGRRVIRFRAAVVMGSPVDGGRRTPRPRCRRMITAHRFRCAPEPLSTRARRL